MMPLMAFVGDLSLTAFLSFALYFIFIIGIGIYSARFSSQGISEYFIGGRQMGRFVVALSAVVSGRSAWLLLGFTGLAYTRGFDAIWAAVGYTVIEFFLFLYYAPRLRDFSAQHQCITLPDYYAARFNDEKGYLRILIVAIFLVFMVGYVSAQFVAGGKAFASSFGIEQDTGVLIAAGIILLYTLLGGFMAVSLTDVLQGIFMILALLLLPIIGIWNMGGWQEITGKLAEIEGNQLNLFDISTLTWIGFIGIGLGSPGNPHILIRYMSMKDPKQFKWTAVVGTSWNALMAIGALLVGLVGRAYIPEVQSLPENDNENILPELAQMLAHPIFYGFLLASVFAAIMSTADSQLLVAASSVVRDTYDRIIHKGETLDQNRLVWMSRGVVLIIVIIGVFLGIAAEEQVFFLVLFAWSGLGAALGSTSILALFWQKTTKAGVVAGLLTGTVSVFVWYHIPALKERMEELVPAFILAFGATVLISLLTKNKA